VEIHIPRPKLAYACANQVQKSATRKRGLKLSLFEPDD
jgi:hypothetical protein